MGNEDLLRRVELLTRKIDRAVIYKKNEERTKNHVFCLLALKGLRIANIKIYIL